MVGTEDVLATFCFGEYIHTPLIDHAETLYRTLLKVLGTERANVTKV